MSVYKVTFPVYGYSRQDVEALNEEIVEADSEDAAAAMFPGVEVLDVRECNSYFSAVWRGMTNPETAPHYEHRKEMRKGPKPPWQWVEDHPDCFICQHMAMKGPRRPERDRKPWFEFDPVTGEIEWNDWKNS